MIHFIFILLALAERFTKCSASNEPSISWDDRSFPNLGRKFGADENPHGTSALELQPGARSLTEADCYELMASKVQMVAVMFLIKDKVHPENVWRDWLLPISKVVHPDIECDAQVKKCYTETVMLQPPRSIYDEQGFFTFYVHPKPGVPAFKKGSIFYEREVKDRVKTEWGSHTLSQATRRLLQAAMKNPLNQRFVLLCGSTIPVRPAQFTYSQLIAERRSRFDDYGFTREDREITPLVGAFHRFPVSMHEEWPELAKHVTGHGQFWVLNRKHAEIVDADQAVERLFARHCYITDGLRGDIESTQWCVSDEQYVGTVLNKALGHGLRAEVLDNDPAVLNLIAGRGFEAEDVTIELILKGRNSYNMSSEQLDDVLSNQGKLCHATESPQWPPMLLDQQMDHICREYRTNKEQAPVLSTLAAYPHCPLFIRKFKTQTLDVLGPLLHDMRIISAFRTD